MLKKHYLILNKIIYKMLLFRITQSIAEVLI